MDTFDTITHSSYLKILNGMAIQIALGKAKSLGVWFSLVTLVIVIMIVVFASVASYVTDHDYE